MNASKDPYATVPQQASALLRVDMIEQIAEMNSAGNWWETLCSGKWPTRNNRAMHFAENHSKWYRKNHQISLPMLPLPGV